MNVPYKLPTPKPGAQPAAPALDARFQLEHLYRAIGISAVASALHMNRLATVEDRERAALASHDMPAILRKDDLAA